MTVCVECGHPVSALFTSYGKDNIVLERCPKCNEIADKYTEFDGVIKSIDLILHKVPIYRHILINSSLKISAKQIALFLVYLAMIEVHLLQPERTDLFRSVTIFSTLILYCILYYLVVWLTIRIIFGYSKAGKVRNALVLGSFPQILHLLFIIWDYPRNDQFDNVINVVTLTSHFAALSSIFPNSKGPLLAVILAQLTATRVKKYLMG